MSWFGCGFFDERGRVPAGVAHLLLNLGYVPFVMLSKHVHHRPPFTAVAAGDRDTKRGLIFLVREFEAHFFPGLDYVRHVKGVQHIC
jgi:hypothetical protein